MEKLDITIAESHSADFEEGTWTFQPNEDFVVRAGTYAIINKPDLDKHVQDIAIAFAHKIQIRNERGAILTTFPEMEALFTEFIKQYYK